MTVWLSLLVAIIGVIVYAISVNPKGAEIGRLAYFAGLLAFLLQSAQLISLAHRELGATENRPKAASAIVIYPIMANSLLIS